jgi:serine/threonine protein kinase
MSDVSADKDRPAPADEEPPLFAGATVGKYEIRRLLGKGAMGFVYEALDTALQRPVALKVLAPRIAARQEIPRRFIREARLAARLSHPNAVAVYDVGREDDVYYIAMELVRGRSVNERIAAEGPMDPAEAAGVIAQACRALAAAHRAGMIHRDIKPANIMYADDGTVKLADFGLAKSLDGESGNESLTAEDRVVGTPKYLSPEQARNEPLDGRADIYSLGATYYALLTARPPYAGGSVVNIMYAHCHLPVPDPRQAIPSLPAACAAVVRKAMAKDPQERYRTAEEMLAALEEAGSTTPEPSVGGGSSPFLAEAEAGSSTVVLDGPPTGSPPAAGDTQPAHRPLWADPSIRVGVTIGATAVILAVVVRFVIFAPGPAADGRTNPADGKVAVRPEGPFPGPPAGSKDDAGDRFAPPKPKGPDPSEDRALFHFNRVKQDLARAFADRDQAAMDEHAAELIRIYHFHKDDPPDSPHGLAAAEAKRIAEKHVPGIYARTPPDPPGAKGKPKGRPGEKPEKRPPPPP